MHAIQLKKEADRKGSALHIEKEADPCGRPYMLDEQADCKGSALHIGYSLALKFALLFLVVAGVAGVSIVQTTQPTLAAQSQQAVTLAAAEHLSTCPAVGAITSQSLLVVLLDRSGSLTYEPGATDPDGYSTSITKALADLWPGSMAVIPFSNNTTPVLGPYVLADQAQRDQLKSAVQNYPIGGDTPLAPALHKALDLLKGAAPGSRAVIVTDGSPDPVAIGGSNQVDDIEQNLIPQFCTAGVPISAFGLTLDLTSSDGQNANRLLTDIANRTGGVYKNVTNSHDLAKVVIQLYADWQNLNFLPAVQSAANGDSYAVQIDTYAKKVAFVTFRNNNNSTITLNGPGGLAVPDQVLQKSTDRHYEIDSMQVSGVNQPGTYTVTAQGDTSAQVYALVESHLHAQLLKPTAQTIAYIGQPLQIEAELINDSTPVLPQPNEATLIAHVTSQSNGQTNFSNDVELVQQSNSAIFARQVTVPGPVGNVTITIKAVYLQVPVAASEAHVTIPLEKAKVGSPPRPLPPPCNASCLARRYSTALEIGIPLFLLLLLLLFLLTRKGPYGSLKQGRTEEQLGQMQRPFFGKLFHKSTLSAQVLENYGGFQFNGAQFELVFSGGGVRVRTKSDATRISIRKGSQSELVTPGSRQGVDLANGDSIQVERCVPAIFIDSAVQDAMNSPRTVRSSI